MGIIKVQNERERMILMIATAVSNLPIIYSLAKIAGRQSNFHAFIGWFTMFISICYHCCEALPSQEFILHEGSWHRLDNVGAITSYSLLMIYLIDMSHYPNLRACFELVTFGIVLITQEKAPWKLINTLMPIGFWSSIALIRHTGCFLMYGMKPNYHLTNFKIGWSVMLVAIYFFVKGLDEKNDYLRLHHSAWHLCVTIASYWLWQIVETENPKNKIK
eukprot:34891_1